MTSVLGMVGQRVVEVDNVVEQLLVGMRLIELLFELILDFGLFSSPDCTCEGHC